MPASLNAPLCQAERRQEVSTKSMLSMTHTSPPSLPLRSAPPRSHFRVFLSCASEPTICLLWSRSNTRQSNGRNSVLKPQIQRMTSSATPPNHVFVLKPVSRSTACWAPQAGLPLHAAPTLPSPWQRSLQAMKTATWICLQTRRDTTWSKQINRVKYINKKTCFRFMGSGIAKNQI